MDGGLKFRGQCGRPPKSPARETRRGRIETAAGQLPGSPSYRPRAELDDDGAILRGDRAISKRRWLSLPPCVKAVGSQHATRPLGDGQTGVQRSAPSAIERLWYCTPTRRNDGSMRRVRNLSSGRWQSGGATPCNRPAGCYCAPPRMGHGSSETASVRGCSRLFVATSSTAVCAFSWFFTGRHADAAARRPGPKHRKATSLRISTRSPRPQSTSSGARVCQARCAAARSHEGQEEIRTSCA